MATAKALDKTKLKRELERDRRQRVTRRLKELRALINESRRARREAIQTIRTQCKAARVKLRSVCERRKETASAKGRQEVERRRRELAEERRDETQLRQADRRGKPGMRVTRSERRQESDDEVRQNIPDSLRSVFERVRRHMKGTARKSRTEAFLEWAEENPGEVYAIQSVDAERELAKMIAEHERAERYSKGRGRRGNLALADVPF